MNLFLIHDRLLISRLMHTIIYVLQLFSASFQNCHSRTSFNSAAASMSTIDIARAAEIILNVDRYMLVTIYIVGIIGAIINITTFVQRQIRTNPCSVYFLATSIVDFGIMNVFILLEIITGFNKPLFNLIYSTRIWCKIGNYIMQILPCLSSSYIVLASFDRFCASSMNPTLRKWSCLKVSRIVVRVTFLGWALFSLHIPIAYDRIEDPISRITQCRVAIGSPTALMIIDGFFFSLFNGAIIPFLLCICGLLILNNIKQSRTRVNTHQNTRSNGRSTGSKPITCHVTPIQQRNDTHMLRMLLVQVFLRIILNIPYIVIYLFGYFNKVPKDLLLLLIYIIFSFIGRWFYYINYCQTFYINTLTSRLFRKSLQQQLEVIFSRCGAK